MPINQKAAKQLGYVGKIYELLWKLQGTDEFEAYMELFSGKRDDPKTDYNILNNRQNRRVMVALYQGRNPTIEGLAEAAGLSTDDITARIKLFRANGMRDIKIRKAA